MFTNLAKDKCLSGALQSGIKIDSKLGTKFDGCGFCESKESTRRQSCWQSWQQIRCQILRGEVGISKFYEKGKASWPGHRDSIYGKGEKARPRGRDTSIAAPTRETTSPREFSLRIKFGAFCTDYPWSGLETLRTQNRGLSGHAEMLESYRITSYGYLQINKIFLYLHSQFDNKLVAYFAGANLANAKFAPA